MGLYKGESYSEDEYKNINAATGKPFGQAGEDAVQSQAQKWREQGAPMPGTEAPKEDRSLASQLFDWANTPAGNAVLGGLGIATAAAVGTGLKGRMRNQAETSPKIEPTFDGNGPPPPPPPPPGNNSRFPPGDVTDVASRPAGTDRLQLTGPTQAPAAAMPETPTAPTAPAAPPANIAPEPVKPLTAKERYEEARAALAEHKLDQARKAAAATDAKKTAVDIQGQQGKTFSGDSVLEIQSDKNRMKKDIDASLKTPAPTSSVAPAPVAATPESMPVAPTAAPAEAPTKTVAEIPEGRIPNYMESKTKKNGTLEYKNKQGSDVIGKGGWNWYQSQMGPEAEKEWLSTFGKTNQSYENVQKAINEGKLKGPEVPEGKKGNTFKREPHVPEYIKGSASIKGLAGLAASVGLLGMAGSEKGQVAMQKASQAIKDIGISPDIFLNKGEELGNLGRAYVNAGNPNYKQELQQKLESTNDPEFKKVLQLELAKLSSPSGAVPPPKK
jgi:hypothetical protein